MEAVIKAAERVKGEDWETFRARHGDPGAALVMLVARRCTGLTLREIGEALGGRDYAAVGMAIKRLDRRLSEDKLLRRQLAVMSEMLNVEMSPR